MFFFACLSISVFLILTIWSPFIKTIIVSMICAVVFYPLYAKLSGRLAHSLASILVCLLLVFIVVIPLSVLILLLAHEATQTYAKIVASMHSSKPALGLLKEMMLEIHRYLPGFSVSAESIQSHLRELVGALVGFVMQHSTALISNITDMALQFVLFIFTLFYLLRDGKGWLSYLSGIVPLSNHQKLLIAGRFKETSITTVVGILLTAVFQGIAGGIGFMIASVSPVLLLATAVAFSSLIPLVGSALVWLPAGIVLMLAGNVKSGVFIIIWGALVVSSVDNFLRPYLMKGSSNISPLWILFSVLGGLKFFGMSGILIGPLILTMAITFVSFYKDEYAK